MSEEEEKLKLALEDLTEKIDQLTAQIQLKGNLGQIELPTARQVQGRLMEFKRLLDTTLNQSVDESD